MASQFHIASHPVAVTGRVLKIARLRDEYYDHLAAPEPLLQSLGTHYTRRADLFTFVQALTDRTPRFAYHLEWDHAAVLTLSTYDEWWRRQINDKTRNMIRKAQKAGVVMRTVAFGDDFARGIERIYNETPLRQGRRFRHFGKGFDTIRRDHATFLDRSEFIGAYHRDELIGFIKLVHEQGISHLMQIIALVAHRDKAPTNALIASAVERCAERGVPLLHYGSWSRRSMGDFKRHHAFERLATPRYYVPLTWRGTLALKLGLHRELREMLPEAWRDRLATYRGQWNTFRHRRPKSWGAVAQLAERRS